MYKSSTAHPFRKKHPGLQKLHDDPEIQRLQTHLADIEQDHIRKEESLRKKNKEMIERDRLRHEHFLQEFKTEEQLYAEFLEEQKHILEERAADLEEEEATQRMFAEEEEALEYRYGLYTLHLAIFSITVHAVNADYERRNQQQRLVKEAHLRQVETNMKIRASLAHDGIDGRKDIERLEANDRKVLFTQYQDTTQNVRTVLARRHNSEDRSRLDAIEASAVQQERAKIQEVEDAEQYLLDQLARLDRKCARVTS